MGTLFDTDTDEPLELAPPEVVRALVDQYGYSAPKVRGWSRAKAETVLGNMRRQEHRDLSHGAARAAEDAAAGTPHALNGRELVARIEAAVCLDHAIATDDAAELLLCLTHAMYPLARVELRDVAALVAEQLRINPDTLERIEVPS